VGTCWCVSWGIVVVVVVVVRIVVVFVRGWGDVGFRQEEDF